RHSSQCEECGGEVEGRRKARIGLIVAGGDVAELFQSLEVVFDQVPPLVHLRIVGNERLSISFRRDNGERTPRVQLGAYSVVIESLVGDQRLEVDACNQWHDADAVVTLARKKNEADQVAQSVDERDGFGGQAAARFADGLILSPPFA